MICPIRINCRAIISLMLLLALVVPFANAIADESMELIATIHIDRDSTEITSVTPIGDFNADGYDDLMVGFWQDYPNRYEAANLYYGGPGFDTVPDLVFVGEPHIIETCIAIGEPTGFGAFVSGLGDFNGDGYDDLAIAAPAFCRFNLYNGRVYLFYGSPNPDTTVDMILDGPRVYSGLGMSMVGGDFNGDTLGDLLVLAIGIYYGSQVFIYLGDAQPDTVYDWIYDYTGQEVILFDCFGGSDITGDGFDDFSWYYDVNGSFFSLVFLGGDSLGQDPADTVDNSTIFYPGDISVDGVDDFIIGFDQAWHLCLGGDPLDVEPDYYVSGRAIYSAFIYSLSDTERKLMVDEILLRRFEMYNTGVPFDTIPYNLFDYGHRHGRGQSDIGDINGDGIDDLALTDSLNTYVNIYSIFRTGIDDAVEEYLPEDHGILYSYPNPFNSSTTIVYNDYVEKGGDARIEIYNLLGERIRSVSMDSGKEGMSKTMWDATDDSGRKVSSGIYFARVEMPQKSSAIKLVYLK